MTTTKKVQREIERLHAVIDDQRRALGIVSRATYDAAIARAEKSEAQRIAFGGALVIAHAALADIGDADREPGDDLAWCERRAAEALPFVRRALGLGERGEK